jgi:hypothetical protein
MTQSGIELANLRFLDYVSTYYIYLIIYPGNYVYHFIALWYCFPVLSDFSPSAKLNAVLNITALG